MQTTQKNPQPKVENPYIAKPDTKEEMSDNNEHIELTKLLDILIEECNKNRNVKTSEYYDNIIRETSYYLNKFNNN